MVYRLPFITALIMSLFLLAAVVIGVRSSSLSGDMGGGASVEQRPNSAEPTGPPRAAWGPARENAAPPHSFAPGMNGDWWRAFADLQRSMQLKLAGAIRDLKAGNTALASALLVGIAFLYGVMHAVGPGHGKAVISSYVLADGVTLRRGIILSFLAALVQALTAIAVVWGTMILLKGAGADVRQILQHFEAASGVMIMLAGIWLAALHLQRRLGQRRAHLSPHGTADHHTRHDESCDCGHAHIPTPAQVESASWSEAAAIVLAIGMRPCTGAILLLVFALSQGLFWAGVGGTFAMALGTAITVSAIACTTVGIREAMTRVATAWWAARLHDIAILAGGLLLAMLGLSLFLDAMGPVRPF